MNVRLAIVVLCLVVLASTANAAAQYQMIRLGSMSGGSASQAYGINDAGQVVGGIQTSDGWHAVVWENGVPRDLGVGLATAINNKGQIAGYGGWASHVGIWDGNAFIDFGVAGRATSINDSGQVVGWYIGPDGMRAFVWEKKVLAGLGTYPGYTNSSSALGINDSGQIVGDSWSTSTGPQKACLLDGGVWSDLGVFTGGRYAQANAINDLGEIVGYSYPARGGEHACIFRNGGPVDLGVLPGDEWSHANAINERGQIVGWSESASCFTTAVLWENGKINVLGYGIPTGINEAGQVCGFCYEQDGSRSAVLWLPVPEPGSLGAICLGFVSGGLMCCRRRRSSRRACKMVDHVL